MFKKSAETVLDRSTSHLGLHPHYYIEQIIAMVLATIITLGSMVGIFFIVDMKPATFNEYKPLYERLEALEANPDSLLDEKAKIVVTDEGFEYTVENKECKMTGYFSTDFKLLGNKQEDNAAPIIAVILAAIFVGFAVWWGFMFVAYIVMYTIWFIVLVVIEIRKWYKARKAKKAEEAAKAQSEAKENGEAKAVPKAEASDDTSKTNE